MSITARPLKSLRPWIAALLVLSATAAQAVDPPRENLVSLSATANVDVAQDLLTVRMTTTREGSTAGEVDVALKEALDQALREAKSQAQPGALDMHTGNYSLFPRYASDGRINGWQGRAELVLEGTDSARVAAAAGRIHTLVISDMAFSVSRPKREQHEQQLSEEAIQAFRHKAMVVAKAFGYSGYTLGEVAVQNADDGGEVRPRVMIMAAARGTSAESASAPVPNEPGKATLSVTVSGSVLLTR